MEWPNADLRMEGEVLRVKNEGWCVFGWNPFCLELEYLGAIYFLNNSDMEFCITDIDYDHDKNYTFN